MDETSAPKNVEELIAHAQTVRASDIHLQMVEGAAQVSFRLDGVLNPVRTLSTEIADRVFGRIKYLARLKTYEESLPQDGRIEKSDVNAAQDIRVSTYPTVTGEKLVLRLFASESAIGLGNLGLAPEMRGLLEKVLRQTSGLVLLTGPAGSGKTTTIYACLHHLANLGGRHIISVEDPVERIIPGVMQTEVNEPRGLTFAKAARHLLRQDPEVLVIGEVRDDETAQVCVRAASTGHLVISTLHAGSCKGVLERLLLLCPDTYAAIASVEVIMNQRLLRKLCLECKGAGCSSCLGAGYKGRVVVAEFVELTDAKRRALRQQDQIDITPDKPILESARELVGSGVTDGRELSRVFGVA